MNPSNPVSTKGWENCPVCGQWERKRSLKTHMKNAHGNNSPTSKSEGRHTCTMCPSTFRRPYNLKRHNKLVHLKELPVGPMAMVTTFITKKPTKIEQQKPKQHHFKNPSKIKFKVTYNYSSTYREWLIATCKRQGLPHDHLRHGPRQQADSQQAQQQHQK